MNNFKRKIKSLLTPLAVLLLVVAVAIMTPVASLVGVLQVSAASFSGNSYTLTNLPARYATVGTEIKVSDAPKAGTVAAKLYHVGVPVAAKENKDSIEVYTYAEVGKYEWRFYSDTAQTKLIDIYDVWVSQANYQITMPNVVPTIAPAGLTELPLPKPAKYTKDGEVIELGDNHLEVNAAINGTTLHWGTQVTEKNGKININMTSVANETGTLKVTYTLNDAEGVLLAAKTIEIKIQSINTGKFIFTSNPTAPIVTSLKDAYYQEIELTPPSTPAAKYDGVTFNVESETSIIAIKYSEDKPEKNNNGKPASWDDVAAIKIADAGDYVSVDGLKVTIKKIGWFEFQFKTTTLFGEYKAENNGNGEYWSGQVQVKSDNKKPEIKFVKTYTNPDDIDPENLGDNDYSKYLPMTSKPEVTSEVGKPKKMSKVTTVKGGVNNGIVFPAVFATDNHTAYNDLINTLSITVKQVLTSSFVAPASTNSQTVYASKGASVYDPKIPLTINFGGKADASNNIINMPDSEGLYEVSFVINDIQPANATYKVNNKNPQAVYYFYVKNDFELVTKNGADANAFPVNDVYLWEGKTFEVDVPSFEDSTTPNSNLAVDYYLVGKKNSTVQVAALKYQGGKKINVDLATLKTTDDTAFDITATEVYVYAVARNFTGLQLELKGTGAKIKFAEYLKTCLAESRDNGVTYKRAQINLKGLPTTAATFTSIAVTEATGEKANTYKAGKPVNIASIVTTWGSAIDGKVSLAAYRVQNGKRDAVKIYDEEDNVISSVMFHGKTNEIKNIYFDTDLVAKYQLVVTTKENQDNCSHVYVAEFDITAGSGVGDVELASADVSMAALDYVSNASMTVGETGSLPVVKKASYGNKSFIGENYIMYVLNDDGTKGAEAGSYTITLKGMNDANCVTGNKFVPSYAGDYVFEYNFTMKSKYDFVFKPKLYGVTVANADTGVTSIKMNSAYGEDAVNNVITKTDASETGPAKAIVLDDFLTANRGGSVEFVVDQSILQANLEAKDGKYIYPAIAIPQPNIVNGAFDLSEVEITVQKSGASSDDYLVSNKNLIDNEKESVLGTVNGYYVFRPEGTFKSNGANFMETADDAASAVYYVTYKLPNGSSPLEFKVTVGNPELGEFTLRNNFVTFTNQKGETVAITKDNNSFKLSDVKDNKITINLKDVLYEQGNSAFIAFMEGDGTAAEKAAAKQQYIWENVNVSVSHSTGLIVSSTSTDRPWKEDEKGTDEEMTYTLDITDAGQYKGGTYTVTISLDNPYVGGTPITKVLEFTLDASAETANKNDLSKVWGIILIVLSIGLLAGVVFYFVKTYRETRFLDAPKMNQKAPKTPAKKDKPAEKVEGKKDDVK